MARSRPPRLGAYVLAGDPTWLRSSVLRYYEQLDALVISASSSDHGWTGRPIRASECAAAALSLDSRGIARVLRGEWHDPGNPLAADTAQRQAAVDELSGDAEWILQVDTDELLPDLSALLRLLDEADHSGVDAVEWPMRVLYRQLRNGRYLQVAARDGAPHVEYPGPIAVRAGTQLRQARQTSGAFLRPFAPGQESSLQLSRPAEEQEIRLPALLPEHAILHNSWARSPREVRAKIASWGHNEGLRSQRYFFTTWLPTPLRWKGMSDFHPFASGLWPALAECRIDIDALLVPPER